MLEKIQDYIEYAALGIEIAGVIVMVIGPLFALWRYAFNKHNDGSSYRTFRHDLGKAILLGLEFLVAGDIIATVSTDPTIEKVLVLGIIVLIRTFLSLSLQVELEGRWPWQKKTIGD
ncbi:DUF1622 domain-containing protein [Antarcticibacterium sp. 1MA-6-2]|uniref:DUF1622 domain-containing protein n=1 Tax=Antarcticibacterium sp. 1MA-6-2 TaxID=2908210 RepID=UPI001F2892BD|nr:DUF1622 domain-containing protein [Antarcticibacterium sp. 1MA-6-2]UJH92253.1 DUF1622 domain-containing protein [Antarcticibacterium sp. 1MA-6-2]